MAIIASNRLAGTDGVQPTLTTLGQTGDAPAVLDNTLLEYDNLYTVHGYNTLRMTSNFARHDTGRLTFDLPASGPWSVRFWVRPEPLSDPFNMQEYRHLFTIGTSTLVIRESAARNIVTRLQPQDLAAANSAGTESGSAVTFDQLLRFEITFDGVDQLESSVFAGDATTGARINTWTHTPSDDQFVLSGYRWRKYTTLQNGDTDASTDGLVTPYQEKLLVWDPNSLPNFGADGDFGGETVTATQNFQTERGLTVDGVAGPETQSALDLVVALDADPNDYPIPLWIAGLTITDTGAAIGPLDEIDTSVAATVSVDGAVVAEDTTTTVHGTVSVSGDAQVSKASMVSVDDQVAVEGALNLFKATSSDPVEADVTVTGNVVVTAESLIPPAPPIPPRARLAVYDPAGSFRGYLPHPFTWEASAVLNDVGAMTIRYSELSPGADILDEIPCEIALEISTGPGESYIEPHDCRFIVLRRRRDRADRTRTAELTLASYGWMLRKSRFLFLPFGSEPDEHTFTGVNVAEILLEIFDGSQNPPSPFLPAFVDLNPTFTETTSSAPESAAWAHDPMDITYPRGVDLSTILDAFSQRKFIDWRFNQRNWQMYNAGTEMSRDRTEEVQLRLNGAILEAPEEWGLDSFALRVQARTSHSSATRSGSPTLYWGNWEDMIQMPGDVLLDDMFDATATWLAEARVPKVQHTRRYLVDGIQPVPFVDYRVGDNVAVQTEHGSLSYNTLRVQQITLTFDSDRILKTALVLGDRFVERTVRVQTEATRLINRGGRIWGAGVPRNMT